MSDLLNMTSTPVVEQHVFPPLTLADRSCAVASRSTQALVRVVKGAQDLLFDKHSYEKYQATLIGQGWVVYEDIRGTLDAKADQG